MCLGKGASDHGIGQFPAQVTDKRIKMTKKRPVVKVAAVSSPWSGKEARDLDASLALFGAIPSIFAQTCSTRISQNGSRATQGSVVIGCLGKSPGFQACRGGKCAPGWAGTFESEV